MNQKLNTLTMLVMAVTGIHTANAQAPTHIWSKTHVTAYGLGVFCQDIAVDNFGNVFMVGQADGYGLVDIDPGITGDEFMLDTNDIDLWGVYEGSTHAIILKYDAMGALQWSRIFKSKDDSYEEGIQGCTAVSCDNAGNVYAIGYFNDTLDVDPSSTAEVYLTSHGAYNDIFVVKLNSSGDYVWGFSLGDFGDDTPCDIVCSPSGDFYIGVLSNGNVDMDPGTGVDFLTPPSGFPDMLLAKYNAAGNYIWGHRTGGLGTTLCEAITIDHTGNLLVTGSTSGSSTDFDPGPGSWIISTPSTCFYSAFVTKYASTGNFIWGVSLGSLSSEQSGKAICSDALDNVYVAGSYGGTTDLDPGSGIQNYTSVGNIDVFVIKLDAGSNHLWSTSIGSNSTDDCFAIATDANSNIVIGGYFNGPMDCQPGVGINTISPVAYSDGFISAYNPFTNTNLYASNLGGINYNDLVNEIVMGPTGSIHTGGNFATNIDTDLGSGSYNLTGTFQFFVSKYDFITSVGEKTEEPTIDIWVDNTNEILHLSSNNSMKHPVQLFSSTGQFIKSAPTHANEVQIKIADLPPGFYIVKCMDNNFQLITFTFVK